VHRGQFVEGDPLGDVEGELAGVDPVDELGNSPVTPSTLRAATSAP